VEDIMATFTDDDREQLVQFLKTTLVLIRSLAIEHLNIFVQDLRPAITAAWSEFEADFNQPQAEATIRAIRPDRAIWAGLYGAQLKLKLAVVQHWRQGWEQERANFGFGSKILKKLIDAIDTVLGSIIAATGLDEALKELKDILSNSLDDDN
jgi:hypothetical protein